MNPATPRNERWPALLICLALAAVVFAVFWPALGSEFVSFDDNIYVYDNPIVAKGLAANNVAWIFTHPDCQLYHPLTMLSLLANYQWHGLHPAAYHLTNLIFHAASVILLFLVLWRTTGALWCCAFVAAVFAIHPLRVESVAWVSERKDVMATFFFMATLGAYVHYARKPNSLARYFWVVLAFVLALLSKPTVVTLPFVLLLLDYWPLRRAESNKRLVAEKLPLLALAIAACVINFYAGREAISAVAHVSLPTRLGNSLVAYAIYLRQLFWPSHLAPYYPFPKNGYAPWQPILAAILLALITALVLAGGKKRRWLPVGWFWYLGVLVPMAGFVQVGGFAHADRMTCLPQIGLYIMLTWTAAKFFPGKPLAIAGALIIVALGVCARVQTGYWHDSETLWTHTLACTTNNSVAHDDLGNALFRKGQFREAIAHYKAGLEISPDDVTTENNLAWLLATSSDASLRDGPKAVQLARDASFRTGGKNPSLLDTLAAAYAEAGQFPEAIATAQTALDLARQSGQTGLVNELGGELKLYNAGRPCRQ